MSARNASWSVLVPDVTPLREAHRAGDPVAAQVIRGTGTKGKGPDLSFTDPSFGATARGAARYAGHTEIVALIDERSMSS